MSLDVILPWNENIKEIKAEPIDYDEEFHSLEDHNIDPLNIVKIDDIKTENNDETFNDFDGKINEMSVVHKCQICHQVFPKTSILKRHMKNEHKNANFQCQTCEKQFSKEKQLMLHIKTVHSEIKDFKCDYCVRAFSQMRHLENHVKSVHKGKAI